jgi:dTDP-4-dehydrorhamnose 3,5-epimerase
MFEFFQTPIPGCLEISPRVFSDNRGKFVKVFHRQWFRNHGLHTEFEEEFYSTSSRGVVRGLHFQIPPNEQVKLVYCIAGTVMDIVVDIRKGSPSYGQHAVFELSAERANIIYIPAGLAHGFCVLSEHAIMVYNTSTVHSPECDIGIRWDSVGVNYPDIPVVISKRDQNFPSLEGFESPFTFDGRP